jgi:hypothetical protein
LNYGSGNEPLRDHYYRVRDVMYRLERETEDQAAILIAEEDDAKPWG